MSTLPIPINGDLSLLNCLPGEYVLSSELMDADTPYATISKEELQAMNKERICKGKG